MRIAVLGPVLVDGRPVQSLRSRRVLAALVATTGHELTTHALTEALWGEAAPATAAKSLQNVIVGLRRTLGAHVITTTPDGYRLDLSDDEIDVAQFESSPPEIALSLWRGTPLIELDDWPPAITIRARLIERRAVLVEARLAEQIDRGAFEENIAEFRELVVREPYRDSAWELLVVGLYRSGRQVEALQALHEQRCLLRDELGLEPSARLRALELAVLNHDGSLADCRALGRIPRSLAAERSARWPFAGRQDELAQLLKAWSATLDGRNEPIAIVGTAGIGKTRITAELAAEGVLNGAVVVRVGYDETASAPFAALAESIRSWAQEESDAVELPTALGLLVPDLVRSAPSVVVEDPTVVFDAVTNWLLRIAERNPVMFLLDDVQWATAANVALIRHVTRRLAGTRVLVVLAGRPAAVTRELVAACRARVVELGELDESSTVAMLRRVVDEPAAREVWQRAGGNPFLAVAAALHVNEHGTLGLSSGAAWSLDMMISRLGPAAEMVLSNGALVGLEFGVEPVAAASGVTVEEAIGILEAAVMTGLLAECETERWRFRHDLVRSWQLDRLTATARAQRHAALAVALGRFEPISIAAIAYHYESAGPRYATAAQSSLVAAGDGAMAVGAVSDALDAFRRASRIGATSAALTVRIAAALAASGDPAWLRTALDAGKSAVFEGDAQSLIGAALVAPQWIDSTGGLEVHVERVALIRSALAHSNRAIDQARLLAALADEYRFDPDGTTRADLCHSSIARLDGALDGGEVVSDAAVACVLSTVAESLGPAHVSERHILVERLLNLADHSVDPRIVVSSCWAGASMAIQRADRPAADRWVARFEAAVRAEPAEGALWNLTLLRGTLAVADGRFTEGELQLNESLQIGLALGKPDALTLYGVCLMTLRIMQDRATELIALLEPTFDTPAGRSIAPMMRALVGDQERARELLDRFVVDGVEIIGGRAVSMALFRCWSTAAFFADHVPAADLLYHEMVPLAGYLGHEGPVTAAADEYLGMLAMTLGRWDDAERWLLSAQTLAERFGARLLVLSARYYRLENRDRRTDQSHDKAEMDAEFHDVERELGAMGALIFVRRRERRMNRQA